ncbi:hypothetical protein IK112_01250 [Candidatus Saccharibacteria bacterium]|nr:hypothetical protein [Candidatus Saccharibacteria bacterium]
MKNGGLYKTGLLEFGTLDLLIFTTIVVKITNPKSGLNLITNSSSPVLSAPSSFYSTGARRYPLSYVFSGGYSWGGGYLSNQDSNGAWWSTVAYSDSSAYNLLMNSSYLDPQDNSNKANGFALRCVSRSISARRCPLSYVWSGTYLWSPIHDFNLADQGSVGYWWTTTVVSDSSAYDLYLLSNGLNVQSVNLKIHGTTLRWVLCPWGGEKKDLTNLA